MIREIKTISDATHEWVRDMNAFPQDMIGMLMSNNIDDWHEVTMPVCGDRVYAYNEGSGEIIDVKHNDESETTYYTIALDDNDREIVVEDNDFDVERDSWLPMWGTMWQFGDGCDNWWLEDDNGIQLMSECGFRIYRHDKWGYFFGIDSAGYSFYEAHWIPLYKARGLQWHDTETEE